jgi:hypothetical protein
MIWREVGAKNEEHETRGNDLFIGFWLSFGLWGRKCESI